MTSTNTPASTVNDAAIGRLTVTTKAIAASVAMHGGSTFHMNMLCTV